MKREKTLIIYSTGSLEGEREEAHTQTTFSEA